MGHLTEFKVKIKLIRKTPEPVMALLKRVIIEGDLGLEYPCLFTSDDVFKPEIDHTFFKCRKWWDLLRGKMYEDEDKGLWILELESEFKNYDDEIEKFINWITPYVIGRKKKEYIGWYEPDESEKKYNLYIERTVGHYVSQYKD